MLLKYHIFDTAKINDKIRIQTKYFSKFLNPGGNRNAHVSNTLKFSQKKCKEMFSCENNSAVFAFTVCAERDHKEASLSGNIC